MKNKTKFNEYGDAVTPIYSKDGKVIMTAREFNGYCLGDKDEAEAMTKAEYARAEKRFKSFLGYAAYDYLLGSTRTLDVFLYKAGVVPSHKDRDYHRTDLRSALRDAERWNKNAVRCPWCRKPMMGGDEDPVIERICGTCTDLDMRQLTKLNPKFARKYKAAVRSGKFNAAMTSYCEYRGCRKVARTIMRGHHVCLDHASTRKSGVTLRQGKDGVFRGTTY